jgi:hypothetical protein
VIRPSRDNYREDAEAIGRSRWLANLCRDCVRGMHPGLAVVVFCREPKFRALDNLSLTLSRKRAQTQMVWIDICIGSNL